MESHPTWVRGLKHNLSRQTRVVAKVAPYVGAWIETTKKQGYRTTVKSHPTWVRGLKLLNFLLEVQFSMSHPTWVRGLKLGSVQEVARRRKSHPTWVRGLKREDSTHYFLTKSRTLRGCVD